MRIRATSDPVEMHADDVDAIVLYERAVGPEFVGDRLMTEHVVPVCSPAIRSELRTPADLLWHNYSITSSARASKVGGMTRPSASALLRLMISSKRVCW